MPTKKAWPWTSAGLLLATALVAACGAPTSRGETAPLAAEGAPRAESGQAPSGAVPQWTTFVWDRIREERNAAYAPTAIQRAVRIASFFGRDLGLWGALLAPTDSHTWLLAYPPDPPHPVHFDEAEAREQAVVIAPFDLREPRLMTDEEAERIRTLPNEYTNRARQWCAEHALDPDRVPAAVFEPGPNGLVLVAPIVSLPWRVGFDPAFTRSTPFRTVEEGDVPVPTMHGAPLAGYGESAELHAVALPLGPTGELGLLLLLPRVADVDLDRVVRELSPTTVASWLRLMPSPRPVALAIPRFEIRASMALWPLWADFAGLGRPPAPSASQMDDVRPSVVLEVRVDERGANHAADPPATAPPPQDATLRFDRPFAFALGDWSQGWLIAVGRVDRP